MNEEEMIEVAAKAVFEHWQFAKPVDPLPSKGMPKWVEGGNSLMQDKARDFARTAIEAYLLAHNQKSSHQFVANDPFKDMVPAIENPHDVMDTLVARIVPAEGAKP